MHFWYGLFGCMLAFKAGGSTFTKQVLPNHYRFVFREITPPQPPSEAVQGFNIISSHLTGAAYLFTLSLSLLCMIANYLVPASGESFSLIILMVLL
jgi:hypothetical protein